jgi:capsular exopolysaccharide synthesis family protein
LFLGLLFPSIYIVLVNFVSPQIRTKEELENYCTLTSIGDIPHNERAKVSNVINDNPNSPIVERFHFLRSNINYQLLGATNKLVLVTSSIPNEGKSFISKNLAMSFASANFKTLLIAFDLRKNSSVHRELIPDQMVGLDSYLINEANVEDIISHTQYANLDFISNNQLPPNPATLISSPKVKELLDVVKSYYDYVIIDTPPFGIVSDAFLLMQYSDINLYVARLGVVAKKALKQSMNELSNKDIKNTYLVKNDVTKVEKSSYYAKYSYGETKERKIFGFLRSARAS